MFRPQSLFLFLNTEPFRFLNTDLRDYTDVSCLLHCTNKGVSPIRFIRAIRVRKIYSLVFPASNSQCSEVLYPTIRAGTPATMALSGTSFVTTAPAAIVTLSPMRIGARIVAPVEI